MSLFILAILFFRTALAAFQYNWESVKIGGGGGFVPGIVFNPSAKGLAYARTDIGGLYRLNKDDSWTPLQDYVNDTNWSDWGVDALATDPVDPKNVYIVVGMYTNSWDPNNASFLASSDYGTTWDRTPLPFKAGGNMPGRGMGERLAIDPLNNNIIYFGARSGHGLWKTTDKGKNWKKVDSFKAVGTYIADKSYEYTSDIDGIAAITFPYSAKHEKHDKHGRFRRTDESKGSSRIYVGTADVKSSTYVSDDAGETWKAMDGQPEGVFPHKMKYSPLEKALYITYNNESGPYSAGHGSVYRVDDKGAFTDITPSWVKENKLQVGFGGLAVDLEKPGTIMASALNLWWPDVQIFRSNDSGKTWSTIWDFGSGAKPTYHNEYNTKLAPWITNTHQKDDTKILGWMVEALEIDPFDSDHLLYGTGLTVYGSRDLTKWPAITISSMADGIEETSVNALITPPVKDVALVSGVNDVGGFVHRDLKKAPEDGFEDPFWSSVAALDYAGLSPSTFVRTGVSKDKTPQVAVSTDAGKTWTIKASGEANADSDKKGVAISADGATILWAAHSGSIEAGGKKSGDCPSKRTSESVAASDLKDATIISDKANACYFYAVNTNGFYVSADRGATFVVKDPLSRPNTHTLAANPKLAGHIWIGTDTGLYHTVDFGATVTKVPNVQFASKIAIGKGNNGNDWAVYAFNSIGSGSEKGEKALRKSRDYGASWYTLSNDKHGLGVGGSLVLAASSEVDGQLFVGTNGRGVFVGTLDEA